MLQSPGVCRRSSAVAENSVGLGQGRPFQTAFWPWSVRPTGSGREGLSRASCSEGPAGPPVMTEADGNLRACTVLPPAAPITSRSEPIPVFPLPPECILVRRVWLWKILRRVKHRGAHQGRFHSLRRFSEVKVMLELCKYECIILLLQKISMLKLTPFFIALIFFTSGCLSHGVQLSCETKDM